MIENIKKCILDKKDKIPLMLIYEELKNQYNDYDIKFVLLTYYNYDVELEIEIQKEERENRFYQKSLRKKAFEKYKNRCVISNIDNKILLEVAHIKPVNECLSIQEKADVDNTLLLWVDIHKYFDVYDISINPQTCKVEVKCEYLVKYNNLHIELNDKTRKYLEHHYSLFKVHHSNE